MKRFIAIFLAALMIIALVGCGKQKRKIIELTLSTEDSAAILAAAGIKLPDKEFEDNRLQRHFDVHVNRRFGRRSGGQFDVDQL